MYIVYKLASCLLCTGSIAAPIQMLHQVSAFSRSYSSWLLGLKFQLCFVCVQQPVWSLDMALNNETIVGEDLVAWVMAGIVHVPRSEVSFFSNSHR